MKLAVYGDGVRQWEERQRGDGLVQGPQNNYYHPSNL